MKINYHQLSIRQLHELLKTKILTPDQLTKLVYKRLEQFKKINAVVTSLEQNAIKQTKSITEQEINDNLLAAIPFVMKDNIATINFLTTGSSKILANFIPNYDSTVNMLLTNNKAINIAKTALDELGMGGDGLYAATGHVLNPWNLKHITGGSSSGSAALVAAGIVPFALGTDTGDSIRKPAAYCGIVGFKPTYGLISRNGVFPYAPSLDTVGIFTNHVEDIAIVLDSIALFDEQDFTSVQSKEKDYTQNLNQNNIEGKNIAILNYNDYQWNDIVKSSFDEAIKYLTDGGAKVQQIEFNKELLESLLPVYMIISFAEATSCHANLTGINFGVRKNGKNYQEVMTNSRTFGFGDMVKRRYIIGAYALSENHQEELFNKAKKVRRLIVEHLNTIFKKYDAFIIMSNINPAPKIKDVLEQKKVIKSEHDYLEDLLLLSNLNGGPSINIPLTTVNGLPIGFNINGAPFNDQVILNIASFLSKKINFNNKLVGDDHE